jgi:hypothetical protein
MPIPDSRPPARPSNDPAEVHERPSNDPAEVHERSADRHEHHAVLLDRYGAHRSADAERRQAEDERDAAEGAREIEPD